MINTVKQLASQVLHWFTIEAKLYHWKVLLTLLAAVAVSLGFYNMIQVKNADQIHRLECLRSSSRDDLRTVLFSFAELPPEFGNSAAILAYEDSRRLIIQSVLKPIPVVNCPDF